MGRDGVMMLRRNPSRVVVLEEYIHHLQWQERARKGLTSGLKPREYLVNEIEAAEFALRNAGEFKLTQAERDYFRRSIDTYKAELQKYDMTQFP